MNHETTIKRIQELTNGKVLESGCLLKGIMYDNGDLSQSFSADAVYITETKNCYHLLVEGTTPMIIRKSDFENRFKILGKPITLAVVLRAIEISSNKVSLFFFSKEGEVPNESYVVDISMLRIMYHWNFSKDNFNDQSEETKTFIGGLLGN